MAKQSTYRKDLKAHEKARKSHDDCLVGGDFAAGVAEGQRNTR
ncbi:MAG: hypothetical protein ACLUQ0_01975 [Enterococcus italicus]|nr:hypothetical protein [Enterococcus italicus]